MGWISNLWNRVNPPLPPERRALYAWDVYGDADAGAKTNAGLTVNETTAFKYSVAYSAMTLIADSLSGLPIHAFTEDEKGGQERVPTPSWLIKPHPEVRKYDVINQLMLSLLAWGNAYALLIRRPTDGVIQYIEVLDPSAVTCEWSKTNRYKREYKYQNVTYSSYEMMHIQGPTLPGQATGLSPIGQAREAVALGLTLEEFGARYFSQGALAKIVLEIPKELTSDEAQRIVKTYERFHKGRNNWHRPAIMSGGAKLHDISIPPEDSQFLESRKFQAIDVARWFRVPPHRVGIMDAATSWGSGLAEENRAMFQLTYWPWISRLEEAFTAYAPGGAGRGTFIDLDTQELLHGTFEDQAEVWMKLYTSGLSGRKESRRKIGLPDDLLEGDEFIDPMLQQNPNAPFGGGGGGSPSSSDITSDSAKEKDRKRKQKEAAQ